MALHINPDGTLKEQTFQQDIYEHLRPNEKALYNEFKARCNL